MQILDENKLISNQKIERVKAFNCGCGTTDCKVEGIPQYNWEKIYKKPTKKIDNADPAYGAGLDEEEQKQEQKQGLSNGLPVPKLF